MKKVSRFLFTLLLTMLFLSISGCSGATSAPQTPTEEPSEENTPAPVLATVSEPETADYCLDCHTDKQRLIDTAKAEEVVVSENEGEG